MNQTLLNAHTCLDSQEYCDGAEAPSNTGQTGLYSTQFYTQGHARQRLLITS